MLKDAVSIFRMLSHVSPVNSVFLLLRYLYSHKPQKHFKLLEKDEMFKRGSFYFVYVYKHSCIQLIGLMFMSRQTSTNGEVPYLGTYLTVLTMLDTALSDNVEVRST